MNLRFAKTSLCDVESSLTFRKYLRYLISHDDLIDFLSMQFDRNKFKRYVDRMRKTRNDWELIRSASNAQRILRAYIDAKNANSNFSILTKLCRRIKSINITKQSISFAKIRSFWLINCFSFWFDDFFDLTFFLIWRVCVFLFDQ